MAPSPPTPLPEAGARGADRRNNDGRRLSAVPAPQSAAGAVLLLRRHLPGPGRGGTTEAPARYDVPPAVPLPLRGDLPQHGSDGPHLPARLAGGRHPAQDRGAAAVLP